MSVPVAGSLLPGARAALARAPPDAPAVEAPALADMTVYKDTKDAS